MTRKYARIFVWCALFFINFLFFFFQADFFRLEFFSLGIFSVAISVPFVSVRPQKVLLAVGDQTIEGRVGASGGASG